MELVSDLRIHNTVKYLKYSDTALHRVQWFGVERYEPNQWSGRSFNMQRSLPRLRLATC
jgi:hypothetical protein